MKRTGSFLAAYALEQIGVKFTFGIPGVHNTELYDELAKSGKITPILVTHEGGGAFMADGVSRTSDSIGTLVIVPAAGTTHAMSGIGEAYLDGIPMFVISGGTRRDSGRHYQLHQLDLGRLTDGIVKKYFLIERHEDIIPTIYKAYETAVSGEPGPVFVEIPVELQLFKEEVPALPEYKNTLTLPRIDNSAIQQAVDILIQAEKPGIYVGWGAVDASEETIRLAERLTAPVATTLQGLSSFPGNHPLHAGVGFGPSSLPSAQKAFAGCDALLAVGVRFSELATGSYGVKVPENLIHVDINPEVFNKNYSAKLSAEGDAREVLAAINRELENRSWTAPAYRQDLFKEIAIEKKRYFDSWRQKKNDKLVSPGFFFESLRRQLPDDACMVVDDGNHTFAHYLSMQNNFEIDAIISEALKLSEEGRPVIVDVNIDYSRQTLLTKGVVKTNLSRFPFREKVRFIGRALKRHITG